jgi:hypothetical protein
MMIFRLKQGDTWKLKQSDTCVNGGLLNDDTLIKRRTQVSPSFNQSIIIQLTAIDTGITIF